MNFRGLFTSVYINFPSRQPASAQPSCPERHAISHERPQGTGSRKTRVSSGMADRIVAAAQRYAQRVALRRHLWSPRVWLLVLLMAVHFQCLELPAFAYQDKRPTLQYEASEAVRPGELLVKFRRGVGRQKRQEALSRVASRMNHFQDRNIGRKDRRGPAIFDQLVHIRLKPGVTPKEAVADLGRDPSVEYAEPNLVVHALESFPNDPDFNLLWGLYNTGQTNGAGGADIDAPTAWDTTTGSAEVVVAVIDTGIDYTHPDLTPNMWLNTAEIRPGRSRDLQKNDNRRNSIVLELSRL